jgi:hypothetical protein
VDVHGRHREDLGHVGVVVVVGVDGPGDVHAVAGAVGAQVPGGGVDGVGGVQRVGRVGPPWRNAVYLLQQDENNSNYSTITAVGSDDMEGGYDCYPNTSAFEQGYHAWNTTYALFDYGDVAAANCLQGQTYTTWQNYTVAYGNGFTLPEAETYSTGQVNRWVTVDGTYFMSFILGNMSQDGNPSGWFTSLSNALNNAGLGQTMYYSTNI